MKNRNWLEINRALENKGIQACFNMGAFQMESFGQALTAARAINLNINNEILWEQIGQGKNLITCLIASQK